MMMDPTHFWLRSSDVDVAGVGEYEVDFDSGLGQHVVVFLINNAANSH